MRSLRPVLNRAMSFCVRPFAGKRPHIALLIVSALLIAPLLFLVLLFTYAEWRVNFQLRSQKWTLPSTIYADAPVLYRQMPLAPQDLVSYLQRLDYHRQIKPSQSIGAGEYSVSAGTVVFRNRNLFPTKDLTPVISVTFDGNGVSAISNETGNAILQSYALEPAPIRDLVGGDWEKRSVVYFKDIPKSLRDAVVAIEDRRFYQHHGIDYEAIARAIWTNIHRKTLSEGGSTITQQLVKNYFLTPEKSFTRKVTEAAMSLILETKMTKAQILELYLNEIYLGQRGAMSIQGVGEASHLFFRKDVAHLTVSEAALLAGMIKSPNPFNPYRHPKEAAERRNIVLQEMADQGYLTKAQAETCSHAPIRVFAFDDRINLAPYFGDLVKTQLLGTYNENTIYTKNLHVFTTLNLDMQQSAEETLTSGLQEIDRTRFRKTGKHAQGCLIAIEPKTGYIRAMVGGRSYSSSQYNHVIQSLRQPGSVFKPIVYATAVEQTFAANKQFYTPASVIEDEPWILQYASNQTWEPQNYDGQFHGPVTLRTALSQSMNVATARLAVSVGLEKIAALGKNMGFENIQPYPSMALGAFEVSPWDVARAYTVFANGGVKAELQTIRQVSDAQGKTLSKGETQMERVLHPQTAFIITDMLRSVLANGTASAARQYGFTGIAAGKTGTTDDFRDSWFVGYTPDLLCVVWVGYDDNTPIGLTGAQGALPIWARFMKSATALMQQREFPVPSGIVATRIDPTTGQLATEWCPETSTEIFIAGTEPKEYCAYHSMQYAEFSPPRFSPYHETREYNPRITDGRRTGVWSKLKRRFKHWF